MLGAAAAVLVIGGVLWVVSNDTATIGVGPATTSTLAPATAPAGSPATTGAVPTR